MKGRGGRDEETVNVESADLIRAHAELKKMVRTGEDLLYWDHTSGQRPLTRDERKERREARKPGAVPARPIWHDTDLDPASATPDVRSDDDAGADSFVGEVVVAEVGAKIASIASSAEPTDDGRRAADQDSLGDRDVDDEAATRALERALEPPFSGPWISRAKVAAGAAIATIVVGSLIVFLSGRVAKTGVVTPTAAIVDVPERHTAPRAASSSEVASRPTAQAPTNHSTAPSSPELVPAAATSAGIAPSTDRMLAISKMGSPVEFPAVDGNPSATSKVLVERVQRGAPKRPAQPRGGRASTAGRADLPESPDFPSTAAPPAVKSPADDSGSNLDYELLVPEIRRP